MKKYVHLFLVALLTAVLLTGLSACLPKKGSAGSKAMSKNTGHELSVKIQTLDAASALDKQKALQKASSAGNGMIVVRLMIDGKQVDVASVAPVILARKGDGEKESTTMILFSEDKSSLIFFSRNPKSGQGRLANVPVSDLENKAQFTFPVIKGDGLATANVSVTTVIKGS